MVGPFSPHQGSAILPNSWSTQEGPMFGRTIPIMQAKGNLAPNGRKNDADGQYAYYDAPTNILQMPHTIGRSEVYRKRPEIQHQIAQGGDNQESRCPPVKSGIIKRVATDASWYPPSQSAIFLAIRIYLIDITKPK